MKTLISCFTSKVLFFRSDNQNLMEV